MGFHPCQEFNNTRDLRWYAARYNTPFFVRMGFTNNKSDKVWVLCRDKEGGPIVSKYGRRGSKLREAKTFQSFDAAFQKLNEKKHKKGYSFEEGWALRSQLEQSGLPAVSHITSRNDRHFLVGFNEEEIAEVPIEVRNAFMVILNRQFPVGFTSALEAK